MIPNRMTTLRWSIAAIIAGWMFDVSAPAQAARTTSIDGVYNGSYTSEEGSTTFKLTLALQDNGTLAGVFTFHPEGGPDTTAYICEVVGRYIQGSRQFQLRRSKWVNAPPSSVAIIGLNGMFNPDGGQGAGQILGKMLGRPSRDFEAVRDADESASMASAVAAKKAAVSVVVAGAPQSGPPVTTKPAAAPPSSSTPDASGPTAINGVYVGTFQRSDGNKKLKLSIKATEDGSLTGLFTFDLPGYVGSSVTYKLTGRYVAGAHDYGLQSSPFQFTTVEPMGSLARDPFDASKVQAVHVGIIGPGSIAGSLTGSAPGAGLTNLGWLHATRDRTELADLDSAMAAQLHAAGGVGANAPSAPIARLSSIDGVYNGTYTSAQGSPTKFKLTIRQTGHGNLAGVFTVYLPTDSGTKAYTYSLEGGNDPTHHRFQLMPREWDTVPPKNFETMPFDGTFIPDLSQNSARILNWQIPGPRFGPKFEARWDATESGDINGAIEAQKAVGPSRVPPPTAEQVAAQAAAHAAAVSAHADALKNAPPAQLASKYLVRKSKAYWDAYQTDMIRQVFDGGFGSDMDENQLFRELFCTYVEMFSKKCQAYLPARHEPVTITLYTNRKFDEYHNLISQDTQSWTVEVDSRFAPKYRQFAESLGSPSQGLRTAVGVMTSGLDPRAAMNEMLAPAHDMDRFFATETGPSAAMRQLTENFLRGATGDLSLQQAGAMIEGAEAECDKDLPPGRFARFVDGANAFYRDPANAKYKSSNYTAFNQLLGEKYDRVMTREEEYYYANDFGRRFREQIMQPKEYCTDPEWPRLHPAVEECIAEVR
jgi:hypothetical protein